MFLSVVNVKNNYCENKQTDAKLNAFIFRTPSEMISLTITHEDTDEVVQIAHSPMDPPILSSLIFNSATESSRPFGAGQPPPPISVK